MSWRTYTVFISSTFADMHSERDYLKMFVFPQINEELKQYSISLRVLDLRWGIDTTNQAQESVEEKVLRVCFSEIDRSRPFFIGLLGNRYGWIPPASYASQFAQSGFSENISITAMEIEYAFLLKTGIDGCIFVERNASCLDDIDENIREKYDDAFSSDPIIKAHNPQKQEALKASIKQHLHDKGKGECYKIYSPKWDGNGFSDLVEFGEIVKDALLQQIKTIYSLESHTDPFHEEQNLQLGILRLKLAKTYRRESVIEQLVSKIVDGKGVFSISAPSGAGKSCIYAQLIEHFQQSPDSYIVLYHTTSAGAESRKLVHMLRRWIYQLEKEFNLPHINVTTINDAITYFNNLIKKTPKEKKLLLFIDAVDHFMKNEYSDYLSFYPRTLTDKWLMICTTLPEHVETIREYHKSLYNYQLPPLDEQEALAIINTFLDYNGKEFNKQNLATLMGRHTNVRHCYASPLWLNLALNRLISFNEQDFKLICAPDSNFNDSFTKYVDSQINHYPTDEEELFKTFLQSLSVFYGTMPEKIFKMLSVSANGLEENTIAELLSEEWNALNFATIRSFFQDFITQNDSIKSWRIIHQKCRLRLTNDEKVELCRQIATYYIEQLEQGAVVNDNVFYYLIQSNDTDLAVQYFDLNYLKNGRTTICNEIIQTIEILEHHNIVNFIFEIFSLFYKRRRLLPKFTVAVELKNIVQSVADHFNQIGEYRETIALLDNFYEFLATHSINKDLKSILYILTEPAYRCAANFIFSKDEQRASLLKSIDRAQIFGPISLLLAPIARKFYHWQITRLKE